MIPEGYVGVWGLAGYLEDSQIRAPANKHFLIITAVGEMTKVKDLLSKAPKQKIAIDDKGAMTTIAPDGSLVALGTATLSGGKMHLVAAGGEHHLVYYPVKQ